MATDETLTARAAYRIAYWTFRARAAKVIFYEDFLHNKRFVERHGRAAVWNCAWQSYNDNVLAGQIQRLVKEIFAHVPNSD